MKKLLITALAFSLSLVAPAVQAQGYSGYGGYNGYGGHPPGRADYAYRAAPSYGGYGFIGQAGHPQAYRYNRGYAPVYGGYQGYAPAYGHRRGNPGAAIAAGAILGHMGAAIIASQAQQPYGY